MKPKIPSDFIILINEINKIPENSLLDKILTYCEQNNFDIQEIGDILSENEKFKRTLWIDCVDRYVIQDEYLKIKQNSIEELDEW